MSLFSILSWLAQKKHLISIILTEGNSRGVPGDELVAVHERGQGPDGAILGVQYLKLEAALVGVGQTPGHIEFGASL